MLDIALYNLRQHRQFQHDHGSLLLARVGSEESNHQSVWMPVDYLRAQDAAAVLEIESYPDGVALAMAGCEAECLDGRRGGPGGRHHLPVPASFSIGDTRFEIFDSTIRRRHHVRPMEMLFKDKGKAILNQTLETGPAPSTVSKWFSAIGSLNRWLSSLQELYAHAAACAVESIGLDGTVILRRRDQLWEIAASHLPHPELGIHCDLGILDQLLSSAETMFHGSQSVAGDNSTRISLYESAIHDSATAPAVVVSPLRNAADELAGAIYGYRSVRRGNGRRGIRYLEAHMIELLAEAVSEGIARLEHETEVDQRRTLLKRALASSPNCFFHKNDSEKRDVTILFADLRHSTELSSALEIEHQYELMGHVMDCLTAAVMDHDGYVIDYYGDGLAAMWNAPADQAEHTELACRAGQRMLERLPDVAADWSVLLRTNLQLAIGIHSGIAQVGNAGSKKRMKYGPRGPTVHVASRIEAAAKEIGIPLVVTQSVAERLSNRFHAYRICRALVRGTDEPLELYTLRPTSIDHAERHAWNLYETAVVHFEHDRLEESVASLRTITAETHAVPARFLECHVQRELDRRRNRRRADDVAQHTIGVIRLGS